MTIDEFISARLATEVEFANLLNRDADAFRISDLAVIRHLVEMHRSDREHYCPTDDGSEHFNHNNGWAEAADSPQICPTLRLLALLFADHPDYDESWRP